MSGPSLQPPLVRMPDFGQGTWLNAPQPLSRAALAGRVVLVDFWDYSCVNCIRTLPYLREWHRRYAELGLTVIGVHAPEFRFARDRQQVTAAIAAFDLPYAILLDNEYETWERFANHAWPTKHVIDAQGYIRYQHQGEGAYDDSEHVLQMLLRQRDPGIALPSVLQPLRPEDARGAVCYPTTPELYAGYETAGFFHTPGLGNPPEYVSENPLYFELPEPAAREEDRFYLIGFWRATPEAVVFAGQDHGQLRLNYRALGVNAVLSWTHDPVALMLGLRPEDEAVIEVRQDGRYLTQAEAGSDVRLTKDGKSIVVVDRPRMYELTRNLHFGSHTLQLFFRNIGMAVYSFTFTSCLRHDSLNSY